MHYHAMNDSTHRARELMACLADASRWRLTQALRESPRCVTELAAEVGLSQSCTTRHLQALTREAIVERRRTGKRVLFRLRTEDSAVASLLAWAGAGYPAERRDASVPPSRRNTRTPRAKRDKKQGSTAAVASESKEPGKPAKPPVARRRGDLEDYLL